MSKLALTRLVAARFGATAVRVYAADPVPPEFGFPSNVTFPSDNQFPSED